VSSSKPLTVTKVALFSLIAWAITVLLGVALFWGSGRAASRSEQQMVMWSMALIAAFIAFALFKRSSKADAEGNLPLWKVVITGPLAAAIAVYVTLWLTAPAEVHRTVQVYLDCSGAGGPGNQFTVHYRRPYGKASANGQEDVAVIQDVPREAKELVVDRVECFGFVTEMESKREPKPWKYPIAYQGDRGEVTIRMVKVKAAEDPMPSAADVRALLKDRSIDESRVRAPAKFSKDKVSLTIENSSDRMITFVAYDCAKVFEQAAANVNELGAESVDERDIGKGDRRTWGGFDGFDSPTGWFALYVRYRDASSNRVVQQPLGVFNLFRVREPHIVIVRVDAPGVVFRVSPERSSLGE